VAQKHLMLRFKLVNYGPELLLYQRGYFRFDQFGERISVHNGRRHEELAIGSLVSGVGEKGAVSWGAQEFILRLLRPPNKSTINKRMWLSCHIYLKRPWARRNDRFDPSWPPVKYMGH
jgi:hypothetical protein